MQSVKGMLYESIMNTFSNRQQISRGGDENAGAAVRGKPGATVGPVKPTATQTQSRGFGVDLTNNNKLASNTAPVGKKPAVATKPAATKPTAAAPAPAPAAAAAPTTGTKRTFGTQAIYGTSRPAKGTTTTTRTGPTTRSAAPAPAVASSNISGLSARPTAAPTTRSASTRSQPAVQASRPAVAVQNFAPTALARKPGAAAIAAKIAEASSQARQARQAEESIHFKDFEYDDDTTSEDDSGFESAEDEALRRGYDEDGSEVSLTDVARQAVSAHEMLESSADAMEVDDMDTMSHSKNREAVTEEEEEVEEEEAQEESSTDFGEEVYDIDAHDHAEPRFMAEYINDIYEVLRELESAPGAALDPNFLSRQNQVTPRNRSMVVDWLNEVSMKCMLRSDTVFLAVQLFDRFLHVRLVPRHKLQLIGATALLIASKFEETYSLPADDITALADGDFTKQSLLDMERLMLHCLKWNLTVPTSLLFLRRWGKAAYSDMPLHNLSKFIIELALSEYSVVRWPPSVQAASAVYLARRMSNVTPAWTATLAHYTRLSEEDVLPCAREMNKIIRTECSKPEPKAVVLKYRASNSDRKSVV